MHETQNSMEAGIEKEEKAEEKNNKREGCAQRKSSQIALVKSVRGKSFSGRRNSKNKNAIFMSRRAGDSGQLEHREGGNEGVEEGDWRVKTREWLNRLEHRLCIHEPWI